MERLNNLPLNTKLVAIFVFSGTASSFIETTSSSETEVKREAILILFGCLEVNSYLLMKKNHLRVNQSERVKKHHLLVRYTLFKGCVLEAI